MNGGFEKAPLPLLVAFLLMNASASSAQNLVRNGTFDQPFVPPPSQWQTYSAGQTLFGWLVTQGDVDIVSSQLSGMGSQVLDLNGTVPGGVEQSITTVPGQAYQLNWGFKMNPNLSLTVQYAAEATWNGQKVTDWVRTFSPSAPSETLSFTVVGTGADTLGFHSLGGGTSGFFLDDIALSAVDVPEPSSWALTICGCCVFFICSGIRPAGLPIVPLNGVGFRYKRR